MLVEIAASRCPPESGMLFATGLTSTSAAPDAAIFAGPPTVCVRLVRIVIVHRRAPGSKPRSFGRLAPAAGQSQIFGTEPTIATRFRNERPNVEDGASQLALKGLRCN